MSESEPNELEQAPPTNEVERAIDTLSFTLNQGYLKCRAFNVIA